MSAETERVVPDIYKAFDWIRDQTARAWSEVDHARKAEGLGGANVSGGPPSGWTIEVVGIPVLPCPESPISVQFAPGSTERPGWLLEVLEQVRSAGSLKEDYDGEGSHAVGHDIRAAAELAVVSLYEDRGFKCVGAYPTSDGGIELELEDKYWDGSVVLDSADSAKFFIRTGSKIRQGESSLGDLPERIWDALGAE